MAWIDNARHALATGEGIIEDVEVNGRHSHFRVAVDLEGVAPLDVLNQLFTAEVFKLGVRECYVQGVGVTRTLDNTTATYIDVSV